MSSGGMYTAPLSVADLEMYAGSTAAPTSTHEGETRPGHAQRVVGQCVDRSRGRLPRRPSRVGGHPWCRVPRSPLPSRPRAAAPHSHQGADTIVWLAADDGRRSSRAASGTTGNGRGHPSARQHPAQRHRRTAGCAVVVVRRAQRTRPVSSRGGPRTEYLNEDSSNVLAADERHTPPPSPSAPARRRHRQRDLGPRRRPRAHGSRTRRWPRPNAARSTASSTRVASVRTRGCWRSAAVGASWPSGPPRGSGGRDDHAVSGAAGACRCPGSGCWARWSGRRAPCRLPRRRRLVRRHRQCRDDRDGGRRVLGRLLRANDTSRPPAAWLASRRSPNRTAGCSRSDGPTAGSTSTSSRAASSRPISAIEDTIASTRLRVVGRTAFGQSYADTLGIWRPTLR